MVKTYKNNKNLGMIVGYDINKNKKLELKKLKIKYISNKKQFIKSIDAGIIASPSKNTLKICLLIENNKHCFVEKPMSHELNKTRKLIALAKKKKIIQVGRNIRFNPAIKLAKTLLIRNVLVTYFGLGQYLVLFTKMEKEI